MSNAESLSRGPIAVHPELFGTPLPHTVLGWLGALVLVVGALMTVLTAVEKALEMVGFFLPRPALVGGLALPGGWLAWSVALIYYKLDTATALVVLLGTLVIVAALAVLRRR